MACSLQSASEDPRAITLARWKLRIGGRFRNKSLTEGNDMSILGQMRKLYFFASAMTLLCVLGSSQVTYGSDTGTGDNQARQAVAILFNEMNQLKAEKGESDKIYQNKIAELQSSVQHAMETIEILRRENIDQAASLKSSIGEVGSQCNNRMNNIVNGSEHFSQLTANYVLFPQNGASISVDGPNLVMAAAGSRIKLTLQNYGNLLLSNQVGDYWQTHTYDQ